MDLRRKRYENSLCDFCKEVLDYKDIGAVHAEIEKVLCSDGDKYKLILIPRGHLKSSLITIGYTMKRLVENRNLRVLIVNATYANARNFLMEIKGKFASDKFKEVYPDIIVEKEVQELLTLKRSLVFKEPSVMASGVEKEITGQHYDLIICDDLVSKENTTTPDQIKKVIYAYQSLISILEPGGEMIVTGTRWHKVDLYGHIINKLKSQFVIYKRGIIENGKYIFPEKFNAKIDAGLKANTPPDLYATQYLNEPIAKAYQVFLPEYYSKRYIELPKNVTVINTTVDLARGDTHNSDDTAIVTVGWTPESDLYIIDICFGQMQSEEKVKNIYATYRKFKPQYLGIEKDANQSYFSDLLRLYTNLGYESLPIEPIKSGNEAKEDRIMTLEPLFRAGKVFLPENSNFNQDLIAQLENFTPMGTHGKDDIIDALSMHLKLYVPSTIIPKSFKKLSNEEIEKKDLNYWANNVLWETEKYNKEQKAKEVSSIDDMYYSEMLDFINELEY